MAQGEDRKAALIAELAGARTQISGTAGAVRAELDLGAKVRRSVSQHRWWWIGGAVFIGVVLAKLPARTRKVYVDAKGRKSQSPGATAAQTGIALTVAKLAFDFAKPMIVKWATGRVTDYVRKKAGRDFDDV
jgi:hypothetical protein